MEADIHDVAAVLNREVDPKTVAQFAVMRRLVAIARAHGNDAGLALLAGIWLAEGTPEHEIVARLWPRHQRFRTV